MLADAADEACMLTHAFDCEATDTSRAAEEIAVFVHRVRILFLERTALDHGFTRMMVQQLQRARDLLVQTCQ